MPRAHRAPWLAIGRHTDALPWVQLALGGEETRPPVTGRHEGAAARVEGGKGRGIWRVSTWRSVVFGGVACLRAPRPLAVAAPSSCTADAQNGGGDGMCAAAVGSGTGDPCTPTSSQFVSPSSPPLVCLSGFPCKFFDLGRDLVVGERGGHGCRYASTHDGRFHSCWIRCDGFSSTLSPSSLNPNGVASDGAIHGRAATRWCRRLEA